MKVLERKVTKTKECSPIKIVTATPEKMLVTKVASTRGCSPIKIDINNDKTSFTISAEKSIKKVNQPKTELNIRTQRPSQRTSALHTNTKKKQVNIDFTNYYTNSKEQIKKNDFDPNCKACIEIHKECVTISNNQLKQDTNLISSAQIDNLAEFLKSCDKKHLAPSYVRKLMKLTDVIKEKFY